MYLFVSTTKSGDSSSDQRSKKLKVLYLTLSESRCLGQNLRTGQARDSVLNNRLDSRHFCFTTLNHVKLSKQANSSDMLCPTNGSERRLKDTK